MRKKNGGKIFFEVSVKNADGLVDSFAISADSTFEEFSESQIALVSMLQNQVESFLFESKISKAAAAFSLSKREAEVLRLVVEGRSNSDIGERLDVSVSTVKKHVYNIFNKAGVYSRTQLLSLVYGMTG
ncbi:MAG: response regulator transcription factor [Treponema sp.]|nr:response regulator transcription factor [Treponema sp.]